MLQDMQTTFSAITGQRISASGNNYSTYAYNCGTRANYDDAWEDDGTGHAGKANIGAGEPLRILVTIIAPFVGTGTTVTFRIVDGPTSTPTNTILSTAAIPKATLVAGYQFEMIVPDTSDEYIGLNYYTDNTFETTGSVAAAIVPNVQTNLTW